MTVADVVGSHSGLTAQEYAEMLGRPAPSVRRDLKKLERRGLAVSFRQPDLALDDGRNATVLYWHDTKSDIFVDVGFERVPNFPDSSDRRGWVTHRVVATLLRSTYDVGKSPGDELGHLTISQMPRENFERLYTDIEAFVREFQGISAPTPQDCKRFRKDHEDFRRRNVESALVAYVTVDEAWRRRRIGTGLYVEAAKWMAERDGFVLAESTTQTSEASRVWARLETFAPVVRLKDGRRALSYTDAG